MKLFVRDLGGAGPTLVVLHGLYGSSRNWGSAGRRLAEGFHVLALDLRNHGESPHAPGMSYRELAADVAETMAAAGVETAVVLGHSMGGKTAMRLACDRPEIVSHLLVLDIAPRVHQVDRAPMEAMLGLSLAGVERRAELEARLAEHLDDPDLRKFLLTNVRRTNAGRQGEGFEWQIDLQAIARGLEELGAAGLEPGDRYLGPVDLIAGDRSDYVRPGDLEAARVYFPRARLTVLRAGHNVHIEAQEELVATVLRVTAA